MQVVFDQFKVGVTRLSCLCGLGGRVGSRVRVKGELGRGTIGCCRVLGVWVVKKGWEVSSCVAIY
jgi:hypothetical protein